MLAFTCGPKSSDSVTHHTRVSPLHIVCREKTYAECRILIWYRTQTHILLLKWRRHASKPAACRVVMLHCKSVNNLYLCTMREDRKCGGGGGGAKRKKTHIRNTHTRIFWIEYYAVRSHQTHRHMGSQSHEHYIQFDSNTTCVGGNVLGIASLRNIFGLPFPLSDEAGLGEDGGVVFIRKIYCSLCTPGSGPACVIS